jgi:hypothetical protein
MQKPFQRVLAYNLAAMLVVSVVACLPWGGMDARLSAVVVSACVFGCIFLANVGLAVFSANPEARRAHWLSLLLVFLIGFGTCAIQFSS